MGVLVTGGGGYIGSHMVWRLVDDGEAVTVLDNFSTGFQWAVAPEAHIVNGDCGDRDLVAELISKNNIDAVIHFAGSIVVPDSVADPLGYYENNTVKSHALIQTVVGAGVPHMIFSSTAAVYGTPSEVPVTETAPLVPESPYGRSKMMTEIMLADAAMAHGLRYTALRYFNVAGADPAGRAGHSAIGATHLIKVACEAALGKRDGVTVFGTDYDTPDGTCLRDYIHVTDLIGAHAQALAYLKAGGASLVANCGYGRGFSVLDVVAMVKRVSGVDFRVDQAARRPGDAAASIASPGLIKATLDWQPRHDDLEEIVASALAWEKILERRNARD